MADLNVSRHFLPSWLKHAVLHQWSACQQANKKRIPILLVKRLYQKTGIPSPQLIKAFRWANLQK
jgi:hypothetical protein